MALYNTNHQGVCWDEEQQWYLYDWPKSAKDGNERVKGGTIIEKITIHPQESKNESDIIIADEYIFMCSYLYNKICLSQKMKST